MDEFVPDDMRIYQRALRDRGLAKRTVSNRTSNVKAFLLYLGYDANTIPKSPKPYKTMPEIYGDEELKALFKAVTKPRMNVWNRNLECPSNVGAGIFTSSVHRIARGCAERTN